MDCHTGWIVGFSVREVRIDDSTVADKVNIGRLEGRGAAVYAQAWVVATRRAS
jgi:hypothetical protein